MKKNVKANNVVASMYDTYSIPHFPVFRQAILTCFFCCGIIWTIQTKDGVTYAIQKIR